MNWKLLLVKIRKKAVFLDTLSILQISRRGNGSESLGSDIRDHREILYRMVYETSKIKFHCKSALGASYSGLQKDLEKIFSLY